MSARTKLNVAYANGALFISTLFGLAAGNWIVFLITLAVTLAGSLYSGEIRPSTRRR